MTADLQVDVNKKPAFSDASVCRRPKAGFLPASLCVNVWNGRMEEECGGRCRASLGGIEWWEGSGEKADAGAADG